MRISVCVAEAFAPGVAPGLIVSEGAERSDRDFCRFLAIAQGSNAEVHTQITIAVDIGCVDRATASIIIAQSDSLGRMINRLKKVLNAPD
jgi:four helix bundle protein